jgi:hypothetical protein
MARLVKGPKHYGTRKNEGKRAADYRVMCGDKRIATAHVYRRETDRGWKWCIQMYGSNDHLAGLDLVSCNFDKKKEAVDRAKMEAEDLSCSRVRTGKYSRKDY